jgi:hypothetical protein
LSKGKLQGRVRALARRQRDCLAALPVILGSPLAPTTEPQVLGLIGGLWGQSMRASLTRKRLCL